MCINNINEELIPIFKSITVLNVVEKIPEIIVHPLFVNDKIHVKIFKNYLNDDEIYVDRLERFLNTRPHKGVDDMTILEMVLTFSSLFIYNFEEFLDQNEKKQLIIKFLDVLDYNEKGDVRLEKCIEAVKYLINTLYFYQSQNIKYQNNNLENIALLNQILDILNNATNNLISTDESAQDLFEKHKSYYIKKKDYFKEKHFLEKEQSIKSDNTNAKASDDTKNPYAEYTNVFNKTMPISKAVEHFQVFSTAKSKNGKPFLTEEQFNNFIKKAFCGVSNIPKQKFNMAPRGEKFIIQYKFREFYESYFDYFGTGQVQDIFVRLLTDNFIGWDFKNVKYNFNTRPKKTI